MGSWIFFPFRGPNSGWSPSGAGSSRNSPVVASEGGGAPDGSGCGLPRFPVLWRLLEHTPGPMGRAEGRIAAGLPVCSHEVRKAAPSAMCEGIHVPGGLWGGGVVKQRPAPTCSADGAITVQEPRGRPGIWFSGAGPGTRSQQGCPCRHSVSLCLFLILLCPSVHPVGSGPPQSRAPHYRLDGPHPGSRAGNLVGPA